MKKLCIILLVLLFACGIVWARGISIGIRTTIGAGAGIPPGSGDAVLWDASGDAVLWDASGDVVLWD